MSWSVNVEPTAPADFASAVEHAEPPQHLSGAQRKQLACARAQAIELAGSDYFKDAAAISAGLSGHAGGESPAAGDHVAVRLMICEEASD
jgi:hypothetical protein